MRKYFLMLILTGLLLLTVFLQPAKHTFSVVNETTSPLNLILEKSGANFSDAQVLAWSKINSRYMSVAEMKNLLADVSNKYYNTRCVPQYHIEANYRTAKLTSKLANGKYLELTLQTYQPTAKNTGLSPESYLNIAITEKNKKFELAEFKNEVLQVYRHLGTKPTITIIYTAKFPGRITEEAAANLISSSKKILNLIDSEDISAPDFYAISGYSKCFPEELDIGGKKQNFVLNLRYNIEEAKTYLIYGTPDIGGQE